MNYDFAWRIKCLKVFFGLIFFIFVVRLFDLQVIRGDEFAAEASAQQQKKSILPARRGKILVRKNRYTEDTTPLATNNTLQMLFVDPLILSYPNYTRSQPLSEQERTGNPALAAQLLAPVLIHAHCEKIEGCEIELNPNNWTSTERRAIEAYSKELEKIFTETEKRRVVLMTDVARSRAEEIHALRISGISVENGNIVGDPVQISDLENSAEKLSSMIGLPSDQIQRMLRRSNLRYREITNKIVPEVSEKIWELKRAAEYRDILRGVQLRDEHWRFYPERELGSQILGFVDSSGGGQYGIEGRFDQILRGKSGVILGATNTRGQRIFGDELGIERAQDGSDVVLSIDRLIQGEIEKILAEDLERFQADAGQIIVVEPNSGKILAMVNAPTFDPNDFGEVFARYEISAEMEEADRAEENETFNQRVPTIREKDKYYRYFNLWGAEVFRNKVVTDEYEPGSVIKALTVAGALNSDEITPQTTYDDRGPIKVDEFSIKNSDEVYDGETTMVEVLSRSLNTGIAFITQKMGSQLVYTLLKNFGFGEYTDIELDGEANGQLEYWKDWAESELVTRGFGQGFTASPLQVAMSFAALANGGYLMKPLLIEEIRHENDEVESFLPERIRRVVSDQSARTVRSILRSAVQVGTGRGARVKGYSVLGKTGTSQTYKRGEALTGLGTTIASFAGMGPIDDPAFVILVKYDYPKVSQWGSETAAVTFSRVASFLFDYLKIPPDR